MSRPESIDPGLLRTFLSIVDTGSFTKTAVQIGRTQSAVSLQLQRLEALLAVTLVSRGKGGVVQLTSAGERLVGPAREMIAVNDSIWIGFRTNGPTDDPSQDDLLVPLEAQREAFTSQLMLTLLTNEKFSEAYACVMRHVEHVTRVDPLTIDVREDDLYLSLLSMLEYISIQFLLNTINRQTVLRQRRSGLMRVYETLQPYIDHKRTVWRRPAAYRSFERVIKNYVINPADSSSNTGAVMADGVNTPARA